MIGYFKPLIVKRIALSLTYFVLAAWPAASWAASAPRRPGPSFPKTRLLNTVSAPRARALVGRLRAIGPTAATRALVEELASVDAESAVARYRLAPLALFLQKEDLGAVSDEALNNSLADAQEAMEAASSRLVSQSRLNSLGLAQLERMGSELGEISEFFPGYLGRRSRLRVRAAGARLSARAAAIRAQESRRKIAELTAETFESRGPTAVAEGTFKGGNLDSAAGRPGLDAPLLEFAPPISLAPAQTASVPQTPAALPVPTAASPAAGGSSERLISLDAFRGLTIALMIMVNSPGNDHAHWALRHTVWHGWTPADLVFPSFLAAMGVSVALSLKRRLARGDAPAEIYPQILRRTAIMFLFGLLESAALYFTDTTAGFQAGGTLQMIALCYLSSSLIFLRTAPAAQAAAAVALLAGYWLALTFVPVPGYGAGSLIPEGNLTHFVDRLLLRGPFHTRAPLIDGLLSTIPATAASLMGVLAGQWLASARAASRKAAGLLAAGLAAAAAGLAWSQWFPINKPIWTSSFALFSGGIALAAFSAFYWLVEVRRAKFWTKPLEVFGSNPLLSYLLAGLFYELQKLVPVTLADGGVGNLRDWLCRSLLEWPLHPSEASLIYTVGYLVFCLGLMSVFYSRKVFLRL